VAYVFTAYSSVRVLLGVSAKELPDTVLSDDIFANKLRLELLGVDADILTSYEAALELSTAAALNLVAAFDIFSATATALYCLSGLPMFAPKSITDGKAGFARDAGAPYKATVDRVTAEYSQYKQALTDALTGYDGGSASDLTPAAPIAASSPSYNPVTGV
jgi:hypothetical protein